MTLKSLVQPVVHRLYRQEVLRTYQEFSSRNTIAGIEEQIAQIFQVFERKFTGRVMPVVLKGVIIDIVKEEELAKGKRIQALWNGYKKALAEFTVLERNYRNYIDCCNEERGWKGGLSTIQEPTTEQKKVLSELESKRVMSQQKIEHYQRDREIVPIKEMGEIFFKVLGKVEELHNAKKKLQIEKCHALDTKDGEKEKVLEEQIHQLDLQEEEILIDFKIQGKILGLSDAYWNRLITLLLTKKQNYKGIADEEKRLERVEIMLSELMQQLYVTDSTPLSLSIWLVFQVVIEEIIFEKDERTEARIALQQKCRKEICRGRILEQQGIEMGNGHIEAILLRMREEYVPYGGEKAPHVMEKSREERIEELYVNYFSEYKKIEEVSLIKNKIEKFLIEQDQQLVNDVKGQIKDILTLKYEENKLQQQYIEFVGMEDLDAFKAQASEDQQQQCYNYEKNLKELSERRDALESRLNQKFPAFKKLEDLCSKQLPPKRRKLSANKRC